MMSKFLFKQKIAKFDPYITKLTEAECLRISLKTELIFPLILNHNWLTVQTIKAGCSDLVSAGNNG